MREDPNFKKLNRDWKNLDVLERASLMRDILQPLKHGQRALSRLLYRHISDESGIRYYLRKLDKANPASPRSTLALPGKHHDRSENRVLPIPSSIGSKIATDEVDVKEAELCIVPASVSIAFDNSGVPLEEVDPEWILQELKLRVDLLGGSSGAKTALLQEVHCLLESSVPSGSTQTLYDSGPAKTVSKSNAPSIAAWLLQQCTKGVALAVTEKATEYFDSQWNDGSRPGPKIISLTPKTKTEGEIEVIGNELIQKVKDRGSAGMGEYLLGAILNKLETSNHTKRPSSEPTTSPSPTDSEPVVNDLYVWVLERAKDLRTALLVVKKYARYFHDYEPFYANTMLARAADRPMSERSVNETSRPEHQRIGKHNKALECMMPPDHPWHSKKKKDT